MSAQVRVRGWLLVAAVLVAGPAAAQQNASVQAAQNFRFSAAEVEAVVHARNSIARAVATTPGLGDQIVAASQGNPTIDQVIERLRAIPQVKKAYNNAGLTTRQGVLSELALLLTARAYQNSQQNPGAPPITPAMAANLALYQQYSGQLMAWQSEITGQGPVVDPDIVGVAGAYPDNLQLQNNLDVQQPGNVNAAQDPDIKQPGNVNVAKDPDMRPPGNVNVATDPDFKQPGNVDVATDPDMRPAGNESPSDPDMVNPIATDPDNVSP
jgi:hypothetical protein